MITDAFTSTVGDTVVGITKSVQNENGEFIGNSAIEVSLSTLNSILEAMNLGEGSFFMMIQSDGTVLADTGIRKTNFKNISEINIPDLRTFLSASETDGIVSVPGGTYGTYFTKKVINQRTGYQIVALCPKSTVFGAFYKTLNATILIFIIFATIAALGTAIVTRKVIRPLKTIRNNISDNATQISQGKADLTQRISIKSKNEIGDVAESFNLYSETLQEIIGSMKQTKGALTEAGTTLNNSTAEAMAAITQISSSISDMKRDLTSQTFCVNQTTDSIHKIINRVSSLEGLVTSQAGAVQGASSAVEEMIGNIGEVNRSVDKMAFSFGKLESDAENGAKTQHELQEKISEIEK
jgi:methyl-accepting chemotaxis protein